MRRTHGITIVAKKLHLALTAIVLALILTGCGQNSDQDEVSLSDDTLTAPLPSALRLTPTQTLVVEVIDGGTTIPCTNLSVDTVNDTFTCNITLSGGSHTLTLVHSVIDSTYGPDPVRVATTSGIVVDVVPGQSTPADFSLATLTYDDDDNDGIDNLDELAAGTYTDISDTTPPTASNPQPASGTTDVALGTSIVSVEFNEAMDPTTINTQTFILSGPFGAVSGSVSYDDVTNTAALTLSESLADTSTYTATITTAVQDLAGNAMTSEYNWSFNSANIAWIEEGGGIVKLSSANEELLKLDQVNCRSLSSYTQFALDERDGSLWVGETNGNRLFKLDNQGQLRILLEQNSAQGTAIDPRDGSVWSSEYISAVSRKLIKRDSLGLPVLETALGLSGSMIDNAMDWYEGDNSLWFADYSTNVVKVFGTDPELSDYDLSGPTGSNHLRIGGFVGQPFTISVYPGDGMGTDGYVWASDRDGAVVKLSINGAELLRRTPSGFFEVRHVSADSVDGSVWLGDGNSDRIAKYSAAGDMLVNIGGFSVFRAIESDPFDGGAWVGYFDSSTPGGGVVKLASTGAEDWRRTNTDGDVHSIALQMQSSQRAKTYVSESGTDLNGDGTQGNPYATIAKGISEASYGSIVMVSAGTYDENIQLKSGVDIQGSGYVNTLIQGLGTTHVVDGVGVVNASISGFSITGSSSTSGGVYCADCKGLTVANNWIKDNGNSTTSNGILIMGSTTALLEQNLISGNANSGVVLGGSSISIVRNNIIVNNADNGIYHNSNDPSYIINNVIDSNGTGSSGRSGILTWEDDIIMNNIITNNGWPANPNNNSVGIYVVSPAVPALSYNNVWNNAQGSYANVTPGIGDIEFDPLFIGGGDYQLNDTSNSINTGDPDLYDASVDCAAITERRSDMGVYGGPWGNW